MTHDRHLAVSAARVLMTNIEPLVDLEPERVRQAVTA